jgi:exonuclease-1
MLSGCDYLPSIPGIGLKKAHRMLRKYKTVEKVCCFVRRLADNSSYKEFVWKDLIPSRETT